MQNIIYPLEIMKENLGDYHRRVKELIDSVQLSGFENHFPRELSVGMQQRASIVRALSFDPKVLLMDEPFGALDAYTRDEMDTLILDIWKRTKKTIAFVTHRIEEAVYLANRVFVMTPRPGTNSEVFDIVLPRPLPEGITMESRYFEIVAEIKRKIVRDVEQQKREGEVCQPGVQYYNLKDGLMNEYTKELEEKVPISRRRPGLPATGRSTFHQRFPWSPSTAGSRCWGSLRWPWW